MGAGWVGTIESEMHLKNLATVYNSLCQIKGIRFKVLYGRFVGFPKTDECCYPSPLAHLNQSSYIDQ